MSRVIVKSAHELIANSSAQREHQANALGGNRGPIEKLQSEGEHVVALA